MLPFVKVSVTEFNCLLIRGSIYQLGQFTEPGDLQRAVDAGLCWPADGQTAAGRYEYRQPDGRRLTDERERIAGQPGVHPRHPGAGRHSLEADVGDEVPQREVDEPDDEERVVGERQRPQQEPRHRQYFAVTPEHAIRRAVAEQSDGTQCAGDHRVDDQPPLTLAYYFRFGLVVRRHR